MKKIKLTKDQYALVDDHDFESLSTFKWHARWDPGINGFYAQRSSRDKNRVTIPMARVIMKAPKGMVVDHINHDTLDNRRENLRICTHADNLKNRGKNKNNTSGFKGVMWVKTHQKWAARIRSNKKVYFLGYFDTPLEAYQAYCEACIKYHKDFSKL